MNLKHIMKVAKYALKFYIIYVIIFGVIIFGFHKPKISNYLDTHPVDRFWGERISQDRVALVEERYYSGLVRINIIENTQKTLDIAYHTIHDGVSTDIFLSSILDAADRGVKVRFMLDGLFHNLRGDLKDVIYAFSNHPNIELKFYEPFNMFKPWSWNNRLHDKFIIADSQLAIIGGRNIGDKYFAKDEYNGAAVNDRDVVIINTKVNYLYGSVIYQIENYFNSIWNHHFSEYPITKLTKREQRKGQQKLEYLRDNLESIRKSNPEIFNNSIDWLEVSLPTNKVTLVHNPIERLNKEPWCWYEIINLAETAEESIFIQSPYTIPTRDMRKYLDPDKINPDEVNILTNSLSASPNLFAFSGYMKYRDRIVDSGAKVYEFQGPGSIHAKSYIYDDRITALGSFNFDSRSAYLSTETMVIIDSEDFAKDLKREIEKYTSNSLEVGEDYSYDPDPLVDEEDVSLAKSFIVKILSIINYPIDYML